MASLAHDGSSPIVAALGPTNTGKTHHAVLRMLEHRTGMIGLPLRLLAREVYDRVTTVVGEQAVALVTGEERRIPLRPRFWVCTTEAMPVDRDVDFVAVDEIQLAEHPQRGHVFTDRILRARGVLETWFMGAETMRERVRELVPTAELQSRPRLSRLSNAGRLKLESLPPRSAVVAFSAAQVYELAERIQRAHGGTAVVLGALSPRTRNSQVAMYQAGEVRYLVATDAIGMGLNMNVDLVAFAALRKFDGQRERMLEATELAQIAGRAGRHMNNGAFATLAPIPALAPDTVFALENHAFAPVRRLQWRNSDLDMSSVDALVSSLRMRPRRACLRLVDRAEDQAALLEMSTRPEIRKVAKSPERVALLWAVCQIPDFRQLLLDSHLWLLSEIFGQLCGPRGVVDANWISRQVGRLDAVQGDIETLMTRISFVRTWTYVANHESWVSDAVHWQQRTREIEDRLSDALHERLVQRFVTQGRTVAGWRSLSRGRRPVRAVQPEEVKVQGPFSVLSGWKVAGRGQELAEAPTGVDAWVELIVQAGHRAFQIDEQGRILFEGEWVGRLSKGADLLRPEVVLAVEEALGAGARLRLHRRLLAFARDWVAGLLRPLQGDWLADLSPAARGLVYQLEQRLGTVCMDQARDQVAGLTRPDRDRLREAGIVVGSHVVFSRAMGAPSAIRRRVLLCLVYLSVHKLAYLPDGRGTWCEVDPTVDVSAYTAVGYPVMGDRGVRAEVVERVAGVLGREAGRGAFALPERVRGWLGVESEAEAQSVMGTFGYRRVLDAKEPVLWKRVRNVSRKHGRTRKRPS